MKGVVDIFLDIIYAGFILHFGSFSAKWNKCYINKTVYNNTVMSWADNNGKSKVDQ